MQAIERNSLKSWLDGVNEMLKGVAEKEDISVPADLDPADLDDEYKGALDEVRDAKAMDLDEKYLSMQLEGHEKTVEHFESYIDEGDIQALQSYSEGSLPTRKEHREDMAAF